MTDESLSALQRRVAEQRSARGFTSDPVRLMVLMTEELGEIAAEIKRTWSVNYPDLEVGRLADEVADLFVLLSDLASLHRIDLASAVEDKFFTRDARRVWPSAVSPTDP